MVAKKLKGVEKVAAVLLGLDPECAAALLRNMSDRPLQAIGRAMVELSSRPFTARDAEPCLEEFDQRLRESGGIVNNFQDLLNNAFGEERARDHVQRMELNRERTSPFGPLEMFPPEEVAEVLADENEQVCAMVLCLLKPRAAARILESLPVEQRPGLLRRIARAGRPPLELAEEVASSVLERLGPVSPQRSAPDAGVGAAAAILNFVGGEVEEAIAGSLQESDSDLFKAIDEHRVVMEDLTLIDKKSMQKILAGVDTRVLTMALKGASKEVEGAILENVSKRSRENILEERELLGAVPRDEVQKAQLELLSVVRDLLKKGDLTLQRGGGDDVVE